MASATLLHVGHDFCHRIPVMEKAGFIVCRSACSIDAVRGALMPAQDFGAIAFENDTGPVANEVVSVARELFIVPIILFENPSVDCDERAFDLVIRKLTPPAIWLAALASAIEESRQMREASRRLRLDSAAYAPNREHSD